MISVDEKQKRVEAVQFAMGSVRLEGVVLPEEVLILNTQYINGENNNEEHTRLLIDFATNMKD